MINIALFASGTGSNAKKLLEKEKTLSNINISLLITDQASAGVIEIAKEFNKEIKVIEKINCKKDVHEQKIISILQKNHIEWIFLAGYMKILSPSFIQSFYSPLLKQSKIINIHPSLLPKFKGLNAYEQAFDSDINISGITVHFVDSGVDTGKIIMQETFQKIKKESLAQFKEKGLKIEHKIYPKVLEMLDNAITTKCYKDFQ